MTLAYRRAGAGAPVVLLHGTLTGKADMALALEASLAVNHDVVAFDRPGNGDSERGVGTGSAWMQAALVHEAVERLGLSRPVLVGHSLGAAVALAYAVQHPEAVRGVVAVSPIAFPELRLEHLLFGPRSLPIAGDTLSAALMGFDALAMPLIWRAMFAPQPVPAAFTRAFPVDAAGERGRLRAAGEEAAWLCADLVRSAFAYAGLRTPVRIVAGRNDMVVSPGRHAWALCAVLPDARLELLEGVGHMAHHARPEVVVEAVNAFTREGSTP